MDETASSIVMVIGSVLEKILMGVFNVIVCVTVICIALFIVVLIKSIHDGVFIDDDDIDYLDDDEYEDETWEYGKNENKN